jgi:hypothetical protein
MERSGWIRRWSLGQVRYDIAGLYDELAAVPSLVLSGSAYV